MQNHVEKKFKQTGLDEKVKNSWRKGSCYKLIFMYDCCGLTPVDK